MGGLPMRGGRNAGGDGTRPRNVGNIIRRLLHYVVSYWYLALPALAFSLLSNHLALLGPRYLGTAIDAISDERGVQMDIVMENFVYMLICYVASAILAYLLTLTMVTLSQRITYRMRRQLFENPGG